MPLLDEEFIFSKGRTISLRQRFPSVFCVGNLHDILLGVDGEEIVSVLAMRRFAWCEGNELFRGAMIGAVYTHPMRRGLGLASCLLEAAAKRLRKEKVDFAVLWAGRQAFYARLGWKPADCSVLGEFFPPALSSPEPSAGIVIKPIETLVPSLENLRRSWLDAMTLRCPEDYRQLPPPAERMDLLWNEDQGKIAYALLGGSGKTGFLYELIGHPDNFPALWREACRNQCRIFVNDRIDSPSHRWLANHTGINWQNKNLAMWLPLSKRITTPRLEKWHIPYFDRI